MNLLDSYGKTKDRYLELIHEFPLRPLRNDEELDSAIGILRVLHDKQGRDDAETDYAEVLGELIGRYQESIRKPVAIANADTLTFLLESSKLTPTKFSGEVGIDELTVSELMSGKRKFTRGEGERVAAYFKLLPSVFAFVD